MTEPDRQVDSRDAEVPIREANSDLLQAGRPHGLCDFRRNGLSCGQVPGGSGVGEYPAHGNVDTIRLDAG